MKKRMDRYLRKILSSTTIFKPVRETEPDRCGENKHKSPVNPATRQDSQDRSLSKIFYFTGGKMTKWARLFFAQAASSWP
jgi:hypothetical protein